jgi:predicted nuclease of predicted toxin-antitoxin system
MKVKLDENLSFRIARALAGLGHDVHTVIDEGLRGASDADLWQQIQKEKRFLITQDLEFSDARKYPAGSHAGILLVRMKPGSRKGLADRLLQIFQQENVEAWSSCCVVVTEERIRVTRTAAGPSVP